MFANGSKFPLISWWQTEYQASTDNYRHIQGRLVPCAVCYVTEHSAVYVQLPAKYTCPVGQAREYHGYLMAEQFTAYRSLFTCVEVAFRSGGLASNRGSAVFFFVQGRCESLPCPPYNGRELSCALSFFPSDYISCLSYCNNIMKIIHAHTVCYDIIL